MNELAINGIGDIERMASIMSKSGLFGKTPDQLFALMLIANAEGIHPAIAAQEYDVIQGRPALKGQSALARFQQAGGRIKWIKRDDTEATAEFSHPQGGTLIVSWTLDRAKKMNLDGKDNWKKQPGVMLSWRCVAEGVRAVYPACLNRMYLAEEVQDFEPMRNVTPEVAEAPAPTIQIVNAPTPQEAPSAPAVDPAVEEHKATWRKIAGEIGKDVKGWSDDDKKALGLADLVERAKHRENASLLDIARLRVFVAKRYNGAVNQGEMIAEAMKCGENLPELESFVKSLDNPEKLGDNKLEIF